MELPADTTKILRVITTFNIAGRYEDEKYAFYKKCTKKFTLKYFENTKKLYLWLKKQFLDS